MTSTFFLPAIRLQHALMMTLMLGPLVIVSIAAPAPNNSNAIRSDRDYQLELRRLGNEEARTEIERQRVKNEVAKEIREQGQTWKTALTSAVPIVVAFLTLAYSIWNTQKNMISAYELKLLEIALDGTNSMGAYNRIKLATDFTGRSLQGNLPEVLKKIGEEKYGAIGRLPPETLSVRASLLTLLAEHPDMRKLILDDIDAVYPLEKWGDQIRRFMKDHK
jgi:hypothetical protein